MKKARFVYGGLAAMAVPYLLLMLLVSMLYAGLLPGSDALLSGRHIHALGHYLYHFSKRYVLIVGGAVLFFALIVGFVGWVRCVGGWRRFIPRFAFMLAFTALLAEIVLRLAFALPGGVLPQLQNAELLGDPNTDDFYWVLAARLGGKVERDYVLPVRGWSQTMPSTDNPLGLKNVTREALAKSGPWIYFYGDSFVHGMPFNKKTLPEMIDDKSDFFIPVNLGARGYGVDQMYLTAKDLGMPPAGSEVWVGILTWDLDRAYLEYSYGQKPRYRIKDNELVLSNVPIEQLDQEYVDSFPMPFRSWFLQALCRQWQARQGLERGGPVRDEKIAINHAIMREWSSWCREAGIPLRVILFHTRQDLAEESWRNQAIRDICTEFNIPLFDTADVLLPYLEKVGSWGDELFEEGDFHHTDLANELISDWLANNWASGEGR